MRLNKCFALSNQHFIHNKPKVSTFYLLRHASIRKQYDMIKRKSCLDPYGHFYWHGLILIPT